MLLPVLKHLWEMKQYGVAESWAQVCKLHGANLYGPLSQLQFSCLMKPLEFRENDEVTATVPKNSILSDEACNHTSVG
jgi:hypothetical protein